MRLVPERIQEQNVESPQLIQRRLGNLAVVGQIRSRPKSIAVNLRFSVDQVNRLKSYSEDVDGPIDLHWTWTDASEVEELRALYQRGQRGQWNAEEYLDWSTPLTSDELDKPQIGSSLL